MSPFSSVSLLTLFVKRRITMTEETFDKAFDGLTALLEDANNERYRLRDQARDTQPGELKDEK